MPTVKLYSRGPYVELLQLALTRAGFSPGPIDGVFGPRTLAALLLFQRANGLLPDGVAGQRTWNALEPFLTGYRLHRVARGDTLYRVAMLHGSTLRAVETANPGVDPLNLMIGSLLTVPLPFRVVPEGVSFTYALLGYCVRGLKARYPFLSTGSAGKSVLGRELHYLAIGSGENQVFYNGAHHANEWITSPLLLLFLEDYALAYSLSGQLYGRPARELYAASTLYTVPMVDPDGVDLVTGAIAPGSEAYRSAAALAASYPAIPFPAGWKANIRGIDLNLQYPAGWERAKAIKFAEGYTKPGPRDFVGASPLSAPESRAVYEFTRAHDFRLSLSYHTQGEVIYWRYLDYEPENALAIAQRFARASGYAVADTPYQSGFAGYKDWFIQEYRRPGYTIEAGTGENPLPISQLPAIYAANLGILTLGLTATAQSAAAE